MARFIPIIFSLILFYAHSQEETSLSVELLKKEAVDVRKGKKEKLLSELGKFQSKYDSLIGSEKEKCLGTFSSVIFDNEGNEKVIKKKLTRSERKACLLKVQNFQKDYIEEVFKIRELALKNQYEEDSEKLKQLKKKQLIQINKINRI